MEPPVINAAKVRDDTRYNKMLDMTVAQLLREGGDPFVISVHDTVLRQFYMQLNKTIHNGGDPEVVRNACISLANDIMTGFIMRSCTPSNPLTAKLTQDMLDDLAHAMTETLRVWANAPPAPSRPA